MPAAFYLQALCVHDGWHYKRAWSPWEKRHSTYRFGSFFFRRTWDVPDTIAGGSGEGSWHVSDPPYANGFQFMLGTWERAGGSSSTWQSATPREQVYRAWRIVVGQDGGSWREWPQTSRACGLS